MTSSVVKNSWNCNFADFRDLVLILQEVTTEVANSFVDSERAKHNAFD